jgi:DNA-directed RNA polymerase II subunit RPB2
MDPWPAIESYFEGTHLARLVEHQLESYNNFVTCQLKQTIDMFNPVIIRSEHSYNKDVKKYGLEIHIRFEQFQINRPQIHENNGATKIMFPHEARLRNFTYAASTTVDLHIQYIIRTGPTLDQVQYLNNILKQVHIGKLPIMLKSSICVLTQYSHLSPETTGECRYDPGGYFIINGSEKTILGQEYADENKIHCFPPSNTQKYLYQAEIKCSPDFKRISPKQVNMHIYSSVTKEYTIYVSIPRIRKPIPLFIVFRALGVISDQDICNYVSKDTEIQSILYGSIVEANSCLTQEDAILFITSNAMYTPLNMDKQSGFVKKREFTEDVLKTDLFSHVKTPEQQVFFLGYMTSKLIHCLLGRTKFDDRDSYVNKRVDLAGSLLNNLWRNYFNKFVKDVIKFMLREINTGSWKSTDDYINILNTTNVCKIFKSSTIENGIKRALSTGDFGIKQMNSNKAGSAQVLNRLTYLASLSQLRRINTPMDKGGKLTQPRKLSPSTWGYLCPAETPEGQSVGIVKNLSYMTHVTIQCDSSSLYDYVTPYLIPFEVGIDRTKVFVNGTWVGCTDQPHELFLDMKDKKYRALINIYTSIVFHYITNEICICNDAGRLVRPLFKVKEGKLLYSSEIIRDLKSKKLSWKDLIISKEHESVIEYIDPVEQNASLIAMKSSDIHIRTTHCELDPSTIFGVLASCIPFPEHNQSPRNTYQCAMGKQAIGIHGTNYSLRISDKTAYVLCNPHRPLVDTRVMNMLKLNQLPSGMPLIVAIGTYTGYNQEDSLILNKGSIKRGMLKCILFQTEKDEEKKIHGDNEIRCKPDSSKTRGIKFGNYSKLSADGLMPENTKIENMDIIMGKVVPIKDARNDHTKPIKYEDHSKYHRTDEDDYLDKNYEGINGEGYRFWKGRIRTVREASIGDKFSSRHGQKGTVGIILDEEDMPFTADGVRPDIILNPHAIPSRMTIAQLKETQLGIILLELGLFGDGTAFTDLSIQTISEQLMKLGYETNGNQLMYSGFTGEQLEASIFIGPAFYQRLKHMVNDKYHSRATGPMAGLTRQPLEGRSRGGGLRFGEMERDCTISHGASAFTKERMLNDSDKYKVHVCKKCGLIASYNDINHIHKCMTCGNRTEFTLVEIPYSCKLLFQELITMNVAPRIIT